MSDDSWGDIVVIVITDILIDEDKTSGYCLGDEGWTLDDKLTFFITKTATPDEASQSLNPRVR